MQGSQLGLARGLEFSSTLTWLDGSGEPGKVENGPCRQPCNLASSRLEGRRTLEGFDASGEASQSASQSLFGRHLGLRAPALKASTNIAGSPKVGVSHLGRPDELFASDLPGPPRSRSCLRDWSSVAHWGASCSGAASLASFGAFALLDDPGLTQFRV